MSLFTQTGSWDHSVSKNWDISGGPSFALGAALGGEVKILTFTNKDEQKSKSFVMVSCSVGAKLEAKADVGSLLEMALQIGKKTKMGTDATNSNPLNFSPPAKVTAAVAFSLKELEFANGRSATVGATGGVVDVGIAAYTFYSRSNKKLFTMDDVTMQGTLGAGLNIGSFQLSRLINLTPTPVSEKQKAEAREFKKNLPWKYHPNNRGAGGGA